MRAVAGTIKSTYRPPKKSRLGYDSMPKEFRNLPRGGSRPRDRYDAAYKARVIAGQVPGDVVLRRQKRERRP